MKIKSLFLFLILILVGLCNHLRALPIDSIIHYPCNNNTFWTLNTFGEIQEWQLNNNVVSGGQVILSNSSTLRSLSYCGNSTAQTFFSGLNGGGFAYYNSPGWQVINNSTIHCHNSGGYKQYHYYADGSNLYYFNGSNSSFLLTANFYVADIAVDTLGFSWILTKDLLNNPSLKVVDSLGNAFAPYTYSPSVSVSSNNAYGMFFLNGTLYVGFGSANSFVPGKIVPLIISGSSFYFGTPINFPEPQLSYFFDMASCQGSHTFTGYRSLDKTKPALFPNPTSGIINIVYDNLDQMELYNLMGEKLATFPSGTKTIDLHNFQNGVYILKIAANNKTFAEKIILR